MGRRLISVCVVALFSILLTGQGSIAQSGLCDPDPCAIIANAIADTCSEIGGSCTGPTDYMCTCDTGYAWEGTTHTCKEDGPPAHTPCDGELAIDSSNALDAAKAIGLCEGEVISAVWVKPDGAPDPNPLGRGILDDFGPNVGAMEGTQLLALSTGTARDASDPDYDPGDDGYGYEAGYFSDKPEGAPYATSSCIGTSFGIAYDGIALYLEVSVPSWAHGFSFSAKFYAYDYPDYLCTSYNDLFVAILDPPPVGWTTGNIVIDNLGDPMSVNVAFMQAGSSDVEGTAFEGHGATPWFKVQAPVTAGSTISILFATWDSGDGLFDSTTIIDNWSWLTSAPGYVGIAPE